MLIFNLQETFVIPTIFDANGWMNAFRSYGDVMENPSVKMEPMKKNVNVRFYLKVFI